MRPSLPLLILVYFIVGVLLYGAATPIFESPDEASHFLYAHNLHNTGELPILEDRDTVFASRAVQRHHPPLYYLLGSLLLTGTTREDLSAYLRDNPFAHYGTIAVNNANVLLHPLHPPAGDTMQAAWRLRLLSLILACGTLWCVYRVGLMAFGRRVGLAAMLLAASIPSFVSISGSINNDNAVTFFYSAGLAWVVWIWQTCRLTVRRSLILGAILAGAALSKITGLTLIGVVGLVFLAGILSGRFLDAAGKRQTRFQALWQVITAGLIAGLCVAVLAGWWYGRNLQLYGDALALAATNAIWGRMPPTDPAQIRSEAWGVWESFWLILGHFNVRGPEALYPYVTLISLLSGLGLLITGARELFTRQETAPQDHPPRLSMMMILLLAVAVVVAALIIATRSVNVSQGRILFPAMAAFAPLMIIGLSTWAAPLERLGRRLPFLSYAGVGGAILCLLPLIITHFLTPALVLAPAFAPPRVAAALPDTAIPFQASTIPEGEYSLHLVGYRIAPQVISPDESVQVTVYIQGTHPAEPIFYIKIIDPLTLVPIGSLDVYPGMTPLSQLDPTQLYEFRFTIPIDRTRLTGQTPRRLEVFMGLRHAKSADPGGDNGTSIPWRVSDGTTVDFLRVSGPTLVDPAYVPPPPAVETNVVYGGALRLVGYTVSSAAAKPGDSVSVSLVWDSVGLVPDDWTMALGLIDPQGHVIAQADGPLMGYPTSVWQRGAATETTRTLTLPADTAAADLRLFIGWYRPTDATQRLEAQGEGIDNNLFISPPVVAVTP